MAVGGFYQKEIFKKMATSKSTVFMSGEVYWAKVLGNPRPNYNGDAREWSFEFEPDEHGIAKLKQHKLTDRLKDKYEDQGRGKFIVLRRTEFSKDGNPNTPIRIYDGEGNEWDKTKLLGNKTKVDVKLDIRDYGPGKKKGVYPVAIRVKELVPYQSSEFGGMDREATEEVEVTEKPPKRKDTFKQDFDLDDDVPFD